VISPHELYIYLGTFLALLASGMGAPIPEEIPIVTAGVLAGKGEMVSHWWLLLPVCILGVVVGDGLLYGLGRFFGNRLLQLGFIRRLMPQEKREHIESNFHKYGIKILLFARLLPGIRSPIFIYFLIHFLRRPVLTGDPKELSLVDSEEPPATGAETTVEDGEPAPAVSTNRFNPTR
jgi:membrane protein DedA with SNARE-associated domain